VIKDVGWRGKWQIRKLSTFERMQLLLTENIVMATALEIQHISEQIRKEFAPQKIILFGSHSGGNPDIDSDVDLLVVAEFQGKPWRFSVEIRERIKAGVPLDLMVRTPEQLKERLAKNDMFLTEIMTNGKVLYEA
jgi:predicted nucleotidyltransferase